jgi:hypothetical protein
LGVSALTWETTYFRPARSLALAARASASCEDYFSR